MKQRGDSTLSQNSRIKCKFIIVAYSKYNMWNIQIRKTFTRICIGIPKHWRLSLVQVRKHLLPSWLLGFSTRGKRDTISTMLTVPSDPTTRGHPVVHNWTGLAQVQKSTRFIQLQISTNCFFFLNHPKFSAHRFQAWTSFTFPVHFLSGVFIMTSVIVTSSPRKCEHLRLMCAPARALSRIVLSLTKPKDKI